MVLHSVTQCCIVWHRKATHAVWRLCSVSVLAGPRATLIGAPLLASPPAFATQLALPSRLHVACSGCQGEGEDSIKIPSEVALPLTPKT